MSPDIQDLLDRAARTRQDAHEACLEAEEALESMRLYMQHLRETLARARSKRLAHPHTPQTGGEASRT
jgi:hypothetical protein